MYHSTFVWSMKRILRVYRIHVAHVQDHTHVRYEQYSCFCLTIRVFFLLGVVSACSFAPHLKFILFVELLFIFFCFAWTMRVCVCGWLLSLLVWSLFSCRPFHAFGEDLCWCRCQCYLTDFLLPLCSPYARWQHPFFRYFFRCRSTYICSFFFFFIFHFCWSLMIP